MATTEALTPDRPAVRLEEADADVLLEAIATFADRVVRPAAPLPETPPTAEAVDAVAAAATELGLFAATDPDPLALWGAPDEPRAVGLAVQALSTLASAHTAIAFHLHQLALGAHLARRLGSDAERVLPVLQGRNGLARGALARLLGGRPPDPEDAALLAEYFPHGTDARPLLVQAAHGWDHAMLPALADDGTLRWELWRREDLRPARIEHAHGLEGVATWLLRPVGEAGEVMDADGAGATRLLVEALACNTVAVLALALGALDDAWARARRYVEEREQGGAPIRDHAAIQLLLARAAATRTLARTTLGNCGLTASSADDLAHAARLRLALQQPIAQAATDCLQVFGGYGYMRDYGMERVLRDVRHLTLSFGSSTDLALFVAAEELYR